MTLLNSPRRLWWLMAAFAGTWYLSFIYFPGLYLFVGVNHMGKWFLDTYAILASNDALTLGRDPWAYNPLDPLGRPHVYSHWWLHLRDLGLTRAHNFWLGLGLVGTFFAAALPRLRPRTPGELLWYLVFLCSSSVVLAVDRANNDLAVFALLAPVVPCLQSGRRGVPLVAVLLIGIAAGLKFYPAVAGLVLLASGDGRGVRLRVVVGLLVLAVVGINIAPDVVKFAPVAPKAEGIMTFGASNVFEMAGLKGRAGFLTGAALAVLLFAGWWRVRLFDGWKIEPAQQANWWSFVLGAALLTGCFFAGTNFAYRWIFALWLAPLLWGLPADESAPAGVRRLARITRGLLLIGLWADPAVSAILARLAGRVPFPVMERWAKVFFLWEQPVTWALFACLLGFLAFFIREGVRPLMAPRSG
ncbi:MAG: DUF2029 domain-containing protein [Verrucomicrobia bacterium]|nr:DUF2029 domain-containing protein [Verrucomicrobiota bacterium]